MGRSAATPTPKKRGRPCRYSGDLAKEICARLAEGESLRAICQSAHMPPAPTVRGWVVDDVNGFAEQYARARDVGLDAMAEQVLDIADGKEGEHDVQRDKLRFDARRWYLSKLAPKRYGDRPDCGAADEASKEELLRELAERLPD